MAPLQPRGVVIHFPVMEHCVGRGARWSWLLWTLHTKTLLLCDTVAETASPKKKKWIVLQIKEPGPRRLISDFILELSPFIHFWHLKLDGCTPSMRPLGSPSGLRPHRWKNPVHLTCIAWIHLCVLFGLCRWRKTSEPITSRCSETAMMSSSCWAITGCRWGGPGLSAALFT